MKRSSSDFTKMLALIHPRFFMVIGLVEVIYAYLIKMFL